MLSNTIFDQAQKSGFANSLGYGDLAGVVAENNQNLNGRTVGLNEVAAYSGPLLGSMLANCVQLIPAGQMGTIRLIFSIDTIGNMFSTSVVPTGYSIYNFEVRYKVVKFPQAYIDRAFANEKIFLKTMSFNNSAVQLASGTNGTISLVYNQRYNSIKALFLHSSGTAANSLNKNFESFDITGSGSTGTSGGTYQFMLGGKYYPQSALNTLNNKSTIIMELRNALGSMYQPNNSMSIEPAEFNTFSTGSTTSMAVPSKFYVGVSTEKLHVNYGGEFMSGQGTNNQPITAIINTTVATAQALNVNLIILYDVILEIDLSNHLINVIT